MWSQPPSVGFTLQSFVTAFLHPGRITAGEAARAEERSLMPADPPSLVVEAVGSGAAEQAETSVKKTKVQALLPFAIISISYLLFTVTDGAIRMIVLMHAYSQGFSAMEVATMFTLYELAGVVTNLVAGFAGAKLGIKCTLLTGLALQLVSYGLLFAWPAVVAAGEQACGSRAGVIAFVTVAQMFGGIAKDLTKLGGKSVTKLVTPADKSTRLFRLVSLLTGWKNSLKGVGYFLGSALIDVQYELALWTMMVLIVAALAVAALGLDRKLGTASKKNARFKDVFLTNNPNLNWLSLARCFLFASRDFWFEVPLPFFLRSPICNGLGHTPCDNHAQCEPGALCLAHLAFNASDGLATSGIGLDAASVGSDDTIVCLAPPPVPANASAAGLCANLNVGGGCGGLGWSRMITGAVLAGYIILYGQCQSYTPQLVTGPLKQTPPNQLTEVLWGAINCLPTALMAGIALAYSLPPRATDATSDFELAVWLVGTVIVFALIFAVNSSIHSFLVVHYAKHDKLATSVGFYYMSNAVGRLLGTLGSGVLYTYAGEQRGPYAGSDNRRGLGACFIAGTLSSVLAAAITLKIRDEAAGLRCGPCVCVGAAEKEETSRTSDREPAPAPAAEPAGAEEVVEVGKV